LARKIEVEANAMAREKIKTVVAEPVVSERNQQARWGIISSIACSLPRGSQTASAAFGFQTNRPLGAGLKALERNAKIAISH
jgi:hypothetical protein